MDSCIKFGNLIFSSFEEELKKNVGEEAAFKIIKKGETIFDAIESTPQIKKTFLMVGKIQSGKTWNFISVMANGIKKGVKLFVVMTGLDNELDIQTLDRIKEAFGFKENTNFLKFYSSKDISSDENKLAELIKNIESGKISIINTLKTNVQKVSDKFTANKFLKCQNMLIVDDEGDLASLTHSDKKDSKTYERIREFLENTNSAYLSVTATPHAHILSGKTKILKPSRVFCIDPGKGYKGLEIFAETNKYYKVIEEIDKSKDFISTKIFADSILYYLLVATNLLIIGDFDHRSHSNMLVHTDAKTDSHKKYKLKIEELIKHIQHCIKQNPQSIEFYDILEWMHRIINDNNLNIKIDDNFMEYFNHSLQNLVVSQINQFEKNEINNNFCNIFIGSQLVGRGLTLDNLLVTFFTNRAKNYMAIDTLLQRARWFGYRKHLEYMKVFTTAQIIEDFKNIAHSENMIWQTLKKSEIENIPFEQLEAEIEVFSSRLIPTNKVPTTREWIEKTYSTNSVSDISFFQSSSAVFLQKLKDSNQYFIASDIKQSKYKFKSMFFNSFDELRKILDIDSLADILKINKSIFSKAKETASDKQLNVRVVLVDSKEKNQGYLIPRIRNCQKLGNDYFIDNIFQGKNMDTVDDINKYVGDIYWHTIKGHECDIFLQVHLIDPQCEKRNINNGKCLYAFCLFLPQILLEQSKKSVFHSTKN